MATKRLPDPKLVPDHSEAMTGPGRVVDVPTPTNDIGTEALAPVAGDLSWHEPGWQAVRNPR